MNNIELLRKTLPIFVAGVATVLAFLFIVVYYYFLMLACEFLALVTCHRVFSRDDVHHVL